MEDLLSILLPENPKENLQFPDPTLLQYYRDLDNRIYWIEGEITENLLDLCSKIIDWNREDKGLEIKDRKPIRIYIYSQGGNLEVARTLIEVFKISKTPIYSYALGTCASAASMIFLGAHRKFATKNVSFLFHQGGCRNVEGSYQEVQNFMEDYKKQIAELKEFYVNNTSFDPEYIEEKLKSDWYIYIDEALKKGIVNEVIDDIDILL